MIRQLKADAGPEDLRSLEEAADVGDIIRSDDWPTMEYRIECLRGERYIGTTTGGERLTTSTRGVWYDRTDT